MPDDNLDIELLIAEFEISSAQRKIQRDLKKLEHSIEKQNDEINKLQEELAKETLKASRNGDCQSVDPNHTCMIELDDQFESAAEKANRLTEQYINGGSKEQFIRGMEAIIDELPLDQRQMFAMFLDQERFLRAFSTFEDLSSLIPGLSGFNDSMTNAKLLLTYFQSYAVGGKVAGFLSLIQALSELGVKTVMVRGVIFPLASLSGIGTIPAFLLSAVISTGILDLLKRNEQ